MNRLEFDYNGPNYWFKPVQVIDSNWTTFWIKMAQIRSKIFDKWYEKWAEKTNVLQTLYLRIEIIEKFIVGRFSKFRIIFYDGPRIGEYSLSRGWSF